MCFDGIMLLNAYDVWAGTAAIILRLKAISKYYEMSWERKNFTFHFFLSYIYVMTLVVTVL